MDSWIKLISIIALSSCASIDYLSDSSRKTVTISKEIIESPYAMQTIQFGYGVENIYLLSSSRNSIQTWFKGRDIIISSKEGKIIKTIGLKNDFEITSYKGYKELKESRGLIRFHNPDSNYMPIFFSYNLLKEGTMVKKIDQSSFDYRLIEESFSVPQVGWKGKNFYWVDEDNYVWMSKQIIDPFGNKVRSTTLKKYSD